MFIFNIFVLLLRLALCHDSSIEKLLDLNGHDGVDTATVHISNSAREPYRRLTKREAVFDASPEIHDDLRLKVTMDSSGHILDIYLRPASVVHDGAKVVVRDEEGTRKYVWEDRKCHYHGSLRGGPGVASFHFCNGNVVGAAFTDEMEYSIHPHPYPDPTVDTNNGDEDDLRVVVTWKRAAEPEQELKIPELARTKKVKSIQELTGGKASELAAKKKAKSTQEWATTASGCVARKKAEPSQEITTEGLLATNEVSWPKRDNSFVPKELSRFGHDGADSAGSFSFDLDDGVDTAELSRFGLDESTRKVTRKYPVLVARKRRQANLNYQEVGDSDIQYGTPEEDGVLTAEGDDIRPADVKLSDDNMKESEDLTEHERVVAEFMLVMDEFFIQDLQTRYRYHEDQHFINFAIFKYNGVQAIYGNETAVGFDFHIEIKRIELWYKNPTFYSSARRFDRLGSRMSAVCERWPDSDIDKFDVVQVWARNASGPVGLAWGNSVCRRNIKCFVSQNTNLHWWTEAHEFGHTLGLGHDGPACKPDTGIMGGSMLRFIDCYRNTLRITLRKNAKSCLFRQDVPSEPTVHLSDYFPIFSQGIDQFCQVLLPGSEYLPQGDDWVCEKVFCAVFNKSSPLFGLVSMHSADAGRPCGEGKVCSGRQCLPYNVSTLLEPDPAVVIAREQGEWSGWSDYGTSCSAVCGTGILLFTRSCTAQGLVRCPGSRYKAKLCYESPCPGEQMMSETEITTNRANYVCSFLLLRGVLSKDIFTGFGSVTSSTGPPALAACTAQCLSRQKKVRGPLLAYLPDGTPCNGDQQFPQAVLGVGHYCVRGLCTKFGCDGRSFSEGKGVERDMCGVCGGDNSTCHHGQTDFYIPPKSNVTVQALPAGTTNLMFINRYQRDDKLFMVLEDKDGVVRLDVNWPRWQGAAVDANPMHYAGTYWRFFPKGQVVESQGPVDQPLKIKLYNRGSEEVTKTIYWRFDIPQSIPQAPKCQMSVGEWLGGCICQRNYFGRQCRYRGCTLDCQNGYRMYAYGRCPCACDYNRTHGARCLCLPRFTGRDCQECAIKTCLNHGTLHAENCTCECVPGCTGEDCGDCGHVYKGVYHAHFRAQPWDTWIQNYSAGASGLHGRHPLLLKGIGVIVSLLTNVLVLPRMIVSSH